jgi:transposase InsO family protein
MAKEETASVHERWARFRFGVVGPLLSAPPTVRGELRREIKRLAARTWSDPVRGTPVAFGASTIERWYYLARRVADPVAALKKKVRSDRGSRPSISDAAKRALHAQHRAHPGWTKQLHYDNLVALAEDLSELVPVGSYSSVCRHMKATGLRRVRRPKGRDTEGFRRALSRLDKREVRSFEATHVNALWHFDFHHGSRKVLMADGEYRTPIALGILDDHSRLACHVQWYLDETAGTLAHGLSQGIQKRKLPRATLKDNGAAMVAQEIQEGHERLSVLDKTTLPYSPYQNAKQEIFWALMEGRLVPMLEGVKDLTLRMLNEATQAWVELEYNRKFHSEIGTSPLSRFLEGPDVSRESPSSEELRLAFMRTVKRKQRRSDGTVTVEGRRLEVPSRFRHLERLTVRYATWDLSRVFLVDPVTGTVLSRLYPQDKAANADGRRRSLEPKASHPEPFGEEAGMAPLMKKLLADYAATGLPFAYIPKDEEEDGLVGAEVQR